ncbi:MAG: hypothetical protein JNL38_21840 [Myxococcales bacterium]|nr:hypothetical protein [Myxococcales bacterium]
MSLASAILRDVVDALRADPALAAELRAVIGSQSPAEYTSRRLPPDVRSATTFARVCRGIPEARRQGRTWVCPVDAWTRARAPRRIPSGMEAGGVLAELMEGRR